MPRQVLTLELDGITAGDYLTWCRDPEPPVLDFGLRSIHVDADPLGHTITAVLDWKHPAPAPTAAAIAAGLPLSPGVQVHAIDEPHTSPAAPRRHRGNHHFTPKVARATAAAALSR